MNPSPFTYHRAASVGEAIDLLREHEDAGAKLIAGGHSLLPIMKLRLAEPAHLIDIGGIADLATVSAGDDGLTIGALTTHRTLESDATVAGHAPLLAEMAAKVGDRQVRARGTIGGTVAHADPTADYPAGLLALGAEMVVQGPDGERTIPADDFFVGFLTTALSPDEVVIAVRVPAAPARTGANYQKLANQASGYAVVGVAAVVTLDDSGACADIRIGVTGAGDHATRAATAEDALRGQPLTDQAIKAATDRADEGIDLLDDIHASADYRSRMVRGLARRAVLAAAERAGAQ